jgi:hypothetical protein
MKKTTVLIAALAAIPLASSAAEPAGVASTTDARTAVAAKLSPDRILALRRSLSRQIAVYDAAEGAMRAPTPAEIEALGLPPTSGAPTSFRLRVGGIGARTDASQISLLVVEQGADGKPVVRHADDTRKEAGHAR